MLALVKSPQESPVFPLPELAVPEPSIFPNKSRLDAAAAAGLGLGWCCGEGPGGGAIFTPPGGGGRIPRPPPVAFAFGLPVPPSCPSFF